MKKNKLLPFYHILDLCDNKVGICGKILSDLGADVIKVEKPISKNSNIDAFSNDSSDSQKSLCGLAYNINKRSITLNLESADGKRIFETLVKKTDVVLESFAPGYMGDLGLDYQNLSKINANLIMTSITPFGQSGPHRDFKASDLTLWCLGGMTYVSGDPDRAPVRVSSSQSYLHGGAAGAVGTLIALHHRELTGEPQWVDVSIQETVVHTLMNVIQFWDVCRIILRRSGILRTGLSNAAKQRLIWRCKDGYVNFPIYGGTAGSRSNSRFVKWMESVGIGNKYLNSLNWEEFDIASVSQEEIERIEEPIVDFFERFTKDELYQGAIEREIMLYPVYCVNEIFDDPQLAYRKFWDNVYHPEVGKIIPFPSSPFIFSGERPCIERVALIGDHNEEIYCGELGLTKEELIKFKKDGVI
jgi:crotonobetainyl-CoA:carnitine CoA-transferase CaiB-like acyl-CoA transferase